MLNFVCKELANAIEMVCVLRFLVDINLVAFVTHLYFKPLVDFVLKLVNAIEIMCTLRQSVDINLVAFITYL